MINTSSIDPKKYEESIEKWNTLKRDLVQQRFNREKVVDRLHLLWQNFSSSERKQVWNNMKDVEREFWYSAREAPFIKKQLLIDVAQNSKEKHERTTVLACVDENFLDDTFAQMVKKIKRAFSRVVFKNKIHSFL